MVDYESGVRAVLLADCGVRASAITGVWSSQLPGDKTTWGPIGVVVLEDEIGWEFAAGYYKDNPINLNPAPGDPPSRITPSPSTTTGRLAVTVVGDSEVEGGRRADVLRAAKRIRDVLLYVVDSTLPDRIREAGDNWCPPLPGAPEDCPLPLPNWEDIQTLVNAGFQVSSIARGGPIHDDDVRIWTMVLTVGFVASETEI